MIESKGIKKISITAAIIHTFIYWIPEKYLPHT